MGLIYLQSAESQKKAILEKYPGLRLLFEKLEKIISDNPSRGHEETILSAAKDWIKVRMQAVKLSFFPEQHSIGYDHLAAAYIQANNDIVVIAIRFR